jgi:hypothetical protein
MGSMKRPPRRAQEIRIDRIVLPHGTVGTARVRAAIERELARLLAGKPAQADVALSPPHVAVEAGTDAEAMGVAIARQIHAGLTKGEG